MKESPKIDVKALASLARLEISDTEVAQLEKEIPRILEFVEQVQSVVGKETKASSELRNVVRVDLNPDESGIYTEKILDAAPRREGDRIAVKQVVSRKK